MKTMKQLQAALNEVNNTNNIKVAREHGYYIIKCGGYESGLCYTLKDLVAEIASKATIKMVYHSWTMSGLKVMTIKGVH